MFFRISAQLEEVQLEAGRTTEETRYYSVPPPNTRSGTPTEEQRKEEDKNIYEIVDTEDYQKVDSSERPLGLVRPNFPPPPPPPSAAAATANPSDMTYTAVYSCVKKGATAKSADDEKVL